jgi:hypothetical protein
MSGDRRALRAAFVLLLLATTLGQRVGLSLGSYSLNLALPVAYGLLCVGALSGVLLVSLERLLCYGAVAVLGFASAALNTGSASLASFALLLVIYAPFVFALGPLALAGSSSAWLTRVFLNVALFCALAGILQFYGQFVVRAPWLFDFTTLLPSLLHGPEGYNTVIAVGSFYKSNGFFFLEPSMFSFFMALAALVEWGGERRYARLACFGLALLLTYSGTGLLALAVGLLFPLAPRTLFRIALAGLAGALALWLLGDLLNLSYTLGRVTEFGSERSSAYHRYVGPLRLVASSFDLASASTWLGHGPGTIRHAKAAFDFHDPTWAKLMFEYGLLGSAAVVALFASALRRRDVRTEIRATLFVSWLVLGGNLLAPEHVYLCLALVTLLPVPARQGVATPAARWANAPSTLVATP